MTIKERQNLGIITCPECGREYLASEIFVPKYFFGNPGVVTRDYQKKIIAIDGQDMDLEETYVCDDCGTPLKVSAKVSFKVDVDKDRDFKTKYSTPLYKNRISLWEDQ